MTDFNYDYSEYSDILHVHQKGEDTKGSVEIGDFTLDFGKKDAIVGVEIEHASEFFSNMGIKKSSLNEVKNARILISSRNPQCHVIFLRLELSNKEVKIVSVPLPIVS